MMTTKQSLKLNPDPRKMPPVFIPPEKEKTPAITPDDNNPNEDTNSFLSSNSLLILFGLLLYFAVKK